MVEKNQAPLLGLMSTLEEDDEVENDDIDSEEEEILNRPKGSKKVSSLFADGFEFSFDSWGGEEMESGWSVGDDVMQMAKKKQRDQISLDAKIARAKEMRQLKAEEKQLKKKSLSSKEGELQESDSEEPPDDAEGESEEEGSGSEEGEESEGEGEGGSSGSEESQGAGEEGGGEESEGEEDGEDEEFGAQDSERVHKDVLKEKKARRVPESYFEEPPAQDDSVNFTDMNISRPILKAVASLGYVSPTPIQAATVPVALMGKDICACAATGTGKTAAFFLPILERLLFRPTRIRVTRVLVLAPTRELAIQVDMQKRMYGGVQVHSVGKALAKHMDVELCLAAGGLDVKSQEAALRKNPDVVIATPGRLVDHLHNAPSFSLSTVEILVLDEADKMLDENFEDQMNEIIKLCPVKRQTMLFSATMTDKVEELVRLSLNRPVRLFVDSNTDVAGNLRQEFVRIKAKKEGDREAIITALCCRTFKEHCLIFLPTKKAAHRMRIIFGLLDLKATELHGALSQLQRIESLKAFTEGSADFMLATDLASRGLDIERVKTVINFSMPSTLKQYIHRVGRTARAGRSGRSVSLVGEKERKMLKEIVKQAKRPVKSRIIAPEVIVKYRDKVRALESEIKSILKQEEEEKQLRLSEMEVNKARNLVEHEKEIFSRPARTWIQGGGKREAGPEASRPLSKRAKREEMKKKTFKKAETPEEKAALKMRLEQEYQIRSAKRARRKKNNPQDLKPRRSGGGKVKPAPVIQGFERELTNTSKKPVKDSNKSLGFLPKSKSGKFKSKKRYKRR